MVCLNVFHLSPKRPNEFAVWVPACGSWLLQKERRKFYLFPFLCRRYFPMALVRSLAAVNWVAACFTNISLGGLELSERGGADRDSAVRGAG